MSNIEGRKASRGLAIALVAALVGIVAGAGTMLWLRGHEPDQGGDQRDRESATGLAAFDVRHATFLPTAARPQRQG